MKMENQFDNLNTSIKINLAISYENNDIVKKFCNQYSIDKELGDEYFLELKKFLYLCSSTKEKLAPSLEIDKIWHTFILFTKEYRSYCIIFLGKFIDHVPEVNLEINHSPVNFLIKTIASYEKVFGLLNNKVWQVEFKDESEFDIDWNNESDSNDYSEGLPPLNIGCKNTPYCEPKENSCVYTGNCFDCSSSGQSCVGSNPNDL